MTRDSMDFYAMYGDAGRHTDHIAPRRSGGRSMRIPGHVLGILLVRLGRILNGAGEKLVTVGTERLEA